MRRPARVRDGAGIHGYAVAPALAWSGWRLQVPGGPEGGQYHGYTGDDSDHEVTTLSGPESGWNHVWGGTSLLEGQTLSDHVYRSPGEVRPRPNASGGANVMREYQQKRSPGYAESPGNYAALGLIAPGEPLYYHGAVRPLPVLLPRPIISPVVPVNYGWPAGATEPPLPPAPVSPNTVAQPAPMSTPAPVYTVPVYTVPPVSPSPSPTVAASAQDYLPAVGQPLPAASATTPAASTGTSIDIGAWLQASTLWSAVPNWAIVAGGGVALFMLLGGKKR